MNRKFPQFPLPSSALVGNELVLIWKNGANRRLPIGELGTFLSELEGFDGNPSSLNQEGATEGQVLKFLSGIWTPADESGGGGGIESVTGDGVDNTDPDNPVMDLSDYVDKTSTENVDGTKTFIQNIIGNKALLLDDDNTLNQANGKASIQYTATQERWYFGNPLDASPNKYLVLRMDSMTATRIITAPDTDGELSLVTDFEPDTGNIEFSPLNGKPRKYGFTTALTGNITFDTTGAKETIMTKFRWNDGTLPTVSVSGGGVTLKSF